MQGPTCMNVEMIMQILKIQIFIGGGGVSGNSDITVGEREGCKSDAQRRGGGGESKIQKNVVTSYVDGP